MCVLDGVSFFLLKHNKVWLMAYLKDFDETERAKPSSARHQAKSRVMQQNFIVVSTEEEKRKKNININSSLAVKKVKKKNLQVSLNHVCRLWKREI